MKAVLCTRSGTPDDLVIADLPDPVAGPGEAVVRIAAAALNFFDLLIIAGKYQYKPAFPFSPAAEFAGRVDSLGPGVTELCRGRPRRSAIAAGARRARRLAIAADKLVKVPAGLDVDRAAGLSVTYGTSYYALKDRGRPQARRDAGGARRLRRRRASRQSSSASCMGARVIACASSDDKLAFARQHGADEGVNYAREDLRDALRRLGGEHGIDVRLRSGRRQLMPSRRCARSPGRVAILWLDLPPATFRSCRSIWCC